MMERNQRFFGSIVLIVLFCDQLSKYAVVRFLPEWNFVFFRIHLVKNTGAGFGILQGQTFLLAFISILAMILILMNYKKIEQEKAPQVLWALFLGGVIGNLGDRLFRKFVIDFIDLSFWPAFNIADAALTISAVGLVLYYWKNRE